MPGKPGRPGKPGEKWYCVPEFGRSCPASPDAPGSPAKNGIVSPNFPGTLKAVDTPRGAGYIGSGWRALGPSPAAVLLRP